MGSELKRYPMWIKRYLVTYERSTLLVFLLLYTALIVMIHPFFDHTITMGVEGDFPLTIESARDIDSLLQVRGFWPQGYPLIIWLGKKSGLDPWHVGWGGAALSATLVLYLTYRLTREVGSAVTSIIVMLAIAFNWQFLQLAITANTDMPWMVLVLLSVFALTRATQRIDPRLVFVSGLLAGLSVNIRYTGIIILAALALTILILNNIKDARRTLYLVAVAVIAGGIGMMPTLLLNLSRAGQLLYSKQYVNVWRGIFGWHAEIPADINSIFTIIQAYPTEYILAVVREFAEVVVRLIFIVIGIQPRFPRYYFSAEQFVVVGLLGVLLAYLLWRGRMEILSAKGFELSIQPPTIYESFLNGRSRQILPLLIIGVVYGVALTLVVFSGFRFQVIQYILLVIFIAGARAIDRLMEHFPGVVPVYLLWLGILAVFQLTAFFQTHQKPILQVQRAIQEANVSENVIILARDTFGYSTFLEWPVERLPDTLSTRQERSQYLRQVSRCFNVFVVYDEYRNTEWITNKPPAGYDHDFLEVPFPELVEIWSSSTEPVTVLYEVRGGLPDSNLGRSCKSIRLQKDK